MAFWHETPIERDRGDARINDPYRRARFTRIATRSRLA